jgi:hypothetical protein
MELEEPVEEASHHSLCTVRNCTRREQVYWEFHSKSLWNRCNTVLHNSCNKEIQRNMSYLSEDVDVVTKLMKEMLAFSNEHQLKSHYLNFYHQLIQFSSEFDEIVALARSVIAENSFKNIRKERRRILKFLAKVINSKIFTQYCKYKTLWPLCYTDGEVYSNSEYSEEFEKTVILRIRDHQRQTTEKDAKKTKRLQERRRKSWIEKVELRTEIRDESKSAIENLTQRHIFSQEETNREKVSNPELQSNLSAHSSLIASLKAQLEVKNEKIKLLTQKAEELQEELLKGWQSGKMNEKVRRHRCRQIFNTVYINDMDFGEDLELDMYFSWRKKDIKFIQEIVRAGIQLPRIKSLLLGSTHDAPSEIGLFLEEYYPQGLDIFHMQFSYSEHNDAKRYENILSIVREEIFCVCYEISEGALKDIIKYSHKWNKVSFHGSFIDNEESKENEFDWSGDFSISSLMLDLSCGLNINKKEKAEKIIEFIGKSGVKNSLKTLKLGLFNIKKPKIEKLMRKNGIDVNILE